MYLHLCDMKQQSNEGGTAEGLPTRPERNIWGIRRRPVVEETRGATSEQGSSRLGERRARSGAREFSTLGKTSVVSKPLA
jgi:hypothetical protein